MRVYLAGCTPGDFPLDIFFDEDPGTKPPYVMASYFYLGGGTAQRGETWKMDYRDTEWCKSLLLDSGAFSFLTNPNARAKFDPEEYLDEYIDFINANDIDLFFELDIDSVVGTAQVREYRRTLERETGKRSIPVWHPERGKDAFIKLCEDYEFIALGGIYDEISPKWFKYFKWFADTAHEHDTRIHGLGFTPSSKDMSQFPFDSVDSSSWVMSAINGSLQAFHPQDRTIQSTSPGEGYRYRDRTQIVTHNLRSWVRYSRAMRGRHGLDAVRGDDMPETPAEAGAEGE